MPFGICSKHSKDDVNNEFPICVEIPDNSKLEVVLCRNSIGLECLEKVCRKLDLTETRYFGLSYKTNKGVEWWLVLETSVRKQLEKYGQNGFDPRNSQLTFKIHFYPRDALLIRLEDSLTRLFLYIQLKSHVADGSLPCDRDKAVLLASYARQAEMGDYFDGMDQCYNAEHSLIPCITNLHKRHRGMSKDKAMLEYIKVTQQLDGYGEEYFPAKGKDSFTMLLGATFLGIIVRHPNGLPPVYFRWPDIVRISHSKKFFCLESTKTVDTIQFEMEDAPTAKYVWKMFVAHHQFCLLNLSKPNGSGLCDSAKLTESVKESSETETNKVSKSKVEGSSPLSSASMEGICNPVFNDERESRQSHTTEEIQLHESRIVDRPASLNLSLKEHCRDGFPLPTRLSTSEHSLHYSERSYEREVLQSVVTNGKGSSLQSMDSGSPFGASDLSHGTQSLESFEERSHRASPTADLSASPPDIRSCGPVTLSLENLADNSSEVTGQTSGYSTSSESDLEEIKESEIGDEQPLTREAQLKELEKILSEGQVFTEFQKVERRSQNLETTSGHLPANVMKNRFKDVIPYEETRVHINSRNNVTGNDYINANFVRLNVADRTYHYIAAQGPMENTVEDFWQMIWEHGVHIIVAATDDKACHPYWCGNVPTSCKTFGAFQVETVAFRDRGAYKVRKLSLQHSSSNERRHVCHLQFTDWPDHGVPSDPKNFLEFLEELESARQQVSVTVGHAQDVHPIAVHCSAGVGRTGVIILTDLMIACLQSNQRMNILRSLINLRRQRMLLVANFGQYRFVYITLIHFIRNSRLI